MDKIKFKMIWLNGVDTTGKPLLLSQIIKYRQQRTDNNLLFFYDNIIAFHLEMSVQISYTWIYRATENEIKEIELYYYTEMNKNSINEGF